MNAALLAYRYLGSGLFYTVFPSFWFYTRASGRHRRGLRQRLGFYPPGTRRLPDGRPRLWLHAASVGEINAASPILRALQKRRPDCSVVVSTTTETGHDTARRKLDAVDACVFVPLDITAAVNRALETFQPDLLVCLETEIWPILLAASRKRGIATALVNGRISQRSIGGYRRIRPLLRETLSGMAAFSMIGETDARRIHSLGAAGKRIEVNGNAKYDDLPAGPDPRQRLHLCRRYGIEPEIPVFVAGSTRGSEEAPVLDAFERLRRVNPHCLLIIAPRHIGRSPQIRRQVYARGLPCQLRSELGDESARRTAPVIVLDIVGELAVTYSLATLSFCGGSLVPLGGQNLMEAAAWGIPVLYGPSTEDFQEARELLEKTGGGVPVRNGRDLGDRAVQLLSQPSECDRIGAAALRAVRLQRGAAGRHAGVIDRLLPEKPLPTARDIACPRPFKRDFS